MQVRETLKTYALLRLPDLYFTLDAVERVVQDVIEALQLDHVSDSIIGDEKQRGISGGQRKRVNVGMEMVADPSLLFLDEPTSGLDSTTSFDVVFALKALSKKGCNIVTVLHQPSFPLYKMFTKVLLLGKGGRTVFLGRSEDALRYFTSIGFEMPPLVNPADFFMDVIAGKFKRNAALADEGDDEPDSSGGGGRGSKVQSASRQDQQQDRWRGRLSTANFRQSLLYWPGRREGTGVGGSSGGGGEGEGGDTGAASSRLSSADDRGRASGSGASRGSMLVASVSSVSSSSSSSPPSEQVDLFALWVQQRGSWRQAQDSSNRNVKPISPAAYALLAPAGFWRALGVCSKRAAIQVRRCAESYGFGRYLIHSFVRAFIHSFIHSFIHLCAYSFMPAYALSPFLSTRERSRTTSSISACTT